MSNRDLSVSELHLMEIRSGSDPIQKYLARRHELEFDVGVYLNRYRSGVILSDGSYEPKPDTLRDGITPQLFKCIYKTEHGVCYVKPVLRKGNLSKRIMCLTDSVVGYSYYWQLDSNYENSLILGIEFKPYEDLTDIIEKEKFLKDKYGNKIRKLNSSPQRQDLTHMTNGFRVGTTIYGAITSKVTYHLLETLEGTSSTWTPNYVLAKTFFDKEGKEVRQTVSFREIANMYAVDALITLQECDSK